MASRQFQLDAETYLNADSNGREFQVDADTYFIEEPAAGGATVVLGQPQVHSFAIMRAANY